MLTEHQPQVDLVGRTAELSRLAELLGLASAGFLPPRPVVLGGDAGVGKSRLLTELAETAEDAGWRVCMGHCLDFGDSALPYLPFTELFGRLVGQEPELLAALVEQHPAVQRLLPGHRMIGGADSGPVDGTRGELFAAVHSALEMIAADRPTLVVIEDVHWADRSTIDLLTFLFTRPLGPGLGLIASFRADDVHRRHPLRTTLAEWSRLPGLTRVTLEPLPERDVRALLRAHRATLPAARVQQIVRRAEGNAFFAEELLGAADTPGGQLPAVLADLLLARLERLGDDARQVVRAVACAWRQVSHELLSEVVALSPDRLDAAVREAVEATVLVPTQDSAYRFRHALLSEAVYDDLLPGERTRLHAAFVAALREGRVTGVSAELARHARAAHDRLTALTASIDAGGEAMSVGGPDEAADHYEHALELTVDPDLVAQAGVDLADLTARTADALLTAGQPHRALGVLRDRLAQPGLPAAEQVVLLSHLGLVALAADDSPVSPLTATGEAVALVGEVSPGLRAEAWSLHARANMNAGRMEEAAHFAQLALDLAEEKSLELVALEAATTLGRLKEFTDDPAASRDALAEVVDRVRASGDAPALIRVLHQLGGTTLELGEVRGAVEYYEQAAELASKHGRQWAPYGLDARVLAGYAAYMSGQWQAAARILDRSGQRPPPFAEALLGSVDLTLAVARGDAAAPAMLEAVRPWWGKDGWCTILGLGPAIELAGAAGDLDGAFRVHDSGIQSVLELWDVPILHAQVRLAALLIGQVAGSEAMVGGTTAERRRLAERCAAVLEVAMRGEQLGEEGMLTHGPECQAWRSRLLVTERQVAWLAGAGDADPQGLVTSWEQTIEAFEVMQDPYETARSRVALATVLDAQGQRAQAREQRSLALAAATELGAAPLVAMLTAAGGEARPAAAPVPADGGPTVELTPREHEVLTLVADGRTNGQIAKQLFISTKTVSVHVSNILAKLGASGRTEAAAIGRRDGLIG